jgi:hypothetical protein
MDQVGASSPNRDTIDHRIINEVSLQTGKIIDTPADSDGYPILSRGTPPEDSDHDGMPDGWEEKQGLDRNAPSGATTDTRILRNFCIH